MDVVVCCFGFRCCHAQPAKANDGCSTPNKGFVNFLNPFSLLYNLQCCNLGTVVARFWVHSIAQNIQLLWCTDVCILWQKIIEMCFSKRVPCWTPCSWVMCPLFQWKTSVLWILNDSSENLIGGHFLKKRCACARIILKWIFMDWNHLAQGRDQ
jgi:hypothetical protein